MAQVCQMMKSYQNELMDHSFSLRKDQPMYGEEIYCINLFIILKGQFLCAQGFRLLLNSNHFYAILKQKIFGTKLTFCQYQNSCIQIILKPIQFFITLLTLFKSITIIKKLQNINLKMSQDNNNNHGQIANNESIAQIQNPNLHLNPGGQQPPPNQPSIITRLYTTLIRTTPKSLFRSFLLILIVFLTIYLTITYLHTTLSSKSPPLSFTSSLTPSPQVYQIGSPQQTAYISFYYFQKMIRMVKQNVKKGNKWEGTEEQIKEFQEVDFWQLYGVFKVLKAVQLANNYQQVDQDTQQQATPFDNPYQNVQNLTSAINLTKYFNIAADQFQCASCYSFPITATIQYQIMKRQGKLIKLSQQELIDCSGAPQSIDEGQKGQKYNGCNDGNVTKGFQYARDVGLVQQGVYPYRSQTGFSSQCKKSLLKANTTKKYQIKGFRTLPTGECRSIQYQLIHGNAVATMINTGRMQYIKNFTQPFRDCIRTGLNHAVTIVGQTANQDWIVRNSWGQNWGDKGYFVIKKGNTCGICTHAMVPFFDGDQLQEVKKTDN